MRYLIILQITLAITVNGFSQFSDALFHTYKNQDLKLRQLSFNGVLSGGNNNSDFLYQFNGGANYSQFINREKLQSDFASSLNIRQSKFRSDYNTGDPLSSSTSISLNASKRSRRYLRNEFFYGLGYRINYGFGHSFLDGFANSDKTEKSTGHSLRIALPMSIGTGRKYPVYSVHKSMWIYSELQKNNSLRRIANVQEIEQLAHLIDQNIYTRFFDFRYKSIDNMSRVDSLLRSQDIITSQNISYFSMLYDMYYYSTGSNRFRGSTLEVGIIGELYYHQSKFTSSDTLQPGYDNNYRAIVPAIFAEYQYLKPINLHWQLNVGFNAEYGFNSLIDEPFGQLGSDKDLLNIQGSASVQYYPNTRSNLTLSLFARYGNKFSNLITNYTPVNDNFYYSDSFSYNTLSQFPLDGFSQANQFNNWFAGLNFIYYYYISPQFRMQSNFSLNYTDQDYVILNTDKLRASFAVSFSYALF